MKPTPPPGKWRHQVIRGSKGRKVVPATETERVKKQLRAEEETPENEQQAS